MRTRSGRGLQPAPPPQDGSNGDNTWPGASRGVRAQPHDVICTYARGRGGPITVDRADCMSLEDGTGLRDGVVDAIARYIWEEELSPEDSADCLVFCSVWNKLLRDVGGGASRLTAITRSVDFFLSLPGCFFSVRAIIGGLLCFQGFNVGTGL